MDTGTGSDDLLGGRLIELPETIRERSSSIDNTLRYQLTPNLATCGAYSTLDRPGLSSHLILDIGSADPLRTSSSRVGLLVKLGDFDVVCHDSSVLNGSQGEGDVHSGIVVLTYLVSLKLIIKCLH